MGGTLHHGDNLDVLRRSVAPASVDLAYLDPPFNSGWDYALRPGADRAAGGEVGRAAFKDSWRWDGEVERLFGELRASREPAGAFLDAFSRVFGRGAMLAYLTQMAPCLTQVHRALRPTGSAYLHCDPTASHALKLLMDAVFGPENFRSEVVWRRSWAHNRGRRFGPVHDILLHYARDARKMAWHPVFEPYGEGYEQEVFGRAEPDGRRYRTVDLTASKPGFRYGWKGQAPSPGRYWACSRDRMEELEAEGRIHYTLRGQPKLKRYLDEMRGVPVQDVWTDIPPLAPRSGERVGYPTQKPEALLERILRASSAPGDVVLDPFCGSGTALVVAERLGRRWIGVDASSVAIRLARQRLDRLPGTAYDVVGQVQHAAGAVVADVASPAPTQG